MIYLLLLLDIVCNNYANYNTYFFIIFLYNKTYKSYLLTGLILDLIIFKTLFINVIILSIIYFLNKVFNDLNKSNLYNYIFINLFNYIFFIFLTNVLSFADLNHILILLGNNLLVNVIFYSLSYRMYISLKN